MNLFVYGTLMDEEIWNQIVRGRYERLPARLDGYGRRRVQGENYPGLIEEEKGHVHGVIYFDVAGEEVERLDRFEGKEYQRIKVRVALEEGKNLECETYLFKKIYRARLTDQDWDFEAFIKKGKNRFIEHYKGWKSF
jgi:gamma-glutamylcyclotransferase (GGCT)/AIG2-like uncharacterized protein YtfP